MYSILGRINPHTICSGRVQYCMVFQKKFLAGWDFLVTICRMLYHISVNSTLAERKEAEGNKTYYLDGNYCPMGCLNNLQHVTVTYYWGTLFPHRVFSLWFWPLEVLTRPHVTVRVGVPLVIPLIILLIRRKRIYFQHYSLYRRGKYLWGPHQDAKIEAIILWSGWWNLWT